MTNHHLSGSESGMCEGQGESGGCRWEGYVDFAIGTILIHVATHVKQSELIGLLQTHFLRAVVRVVFVPRHFIWIVSANKLKFPRLLTTLHVQWKRVHVNVGV